MLEKKIIKIIEIFTLGFVFPILIVYFSLSNYILIFLWIIFLYSLIIFLLLYKEDNAFKKSLKLSNKKIKIYNTDALEFDFNKKKFECFILVDPFKKNYHKKRFLNKLLRLKQKKKFVILINFKQIIVPKQFKIVYSLIAGKERSLKIYKVI